MNGSTSQLALPSFLLPQLQNGSAIPALQGRHEARRHMSTHISCVCKLLCEEEEDGGQIQNI